MVRWTSFGLSIPVSRNFGKWVGTHFFYWLIGPMAHPLIPQIIELATPIADQLGLEIVGAVFQTNQSPPVLRIDVRNPQTDDTGLDDCERMSQALEPALDDSNIIPDAYVLEVSSPGISSELMSDRDFTVFKGFMVEAKLTEPHRGKQTWVGQLVRRDETSVLISQKGKAISLPRELIISVQLSNQPLE
ncbi:MAG TPA: ribosome maturation factor RimP [Trichocoleus sp.]